MWQENPLPLSSYSECMEYGLIVHADNKRAPVRARWNRRFQCWWRLNGLRTALCMNVRELRSCHLRGDTWCLHCRVINLGECGSQVGFWGGQRNHSEPINVFCSGDWKLLLGTYICVNSEFNTWDHWSFIKRWVRGLVDQAPCEEHCHNLNWQQQR